MTTSRAGPLPRSKRRWVTSVLPTVLSLLPGTTLSAQTTLVTEGQWTVQVPDSGCGSMPLMQVKGPTNLFEPANGSALAALQTSLSGRIAQSCPGVHEVILLNGKTRRLVRLDSSAVAATPASAGPSTSASASPPPSAAPVRVPMQTATQTPGKVPVLKRPSDSAPILSSPVSLSSLSGARGTQEKCDVLLRWMESGKVATSSVGSPARAAYGLPPGMISIFRDENMIAVFGRPYDQIDNSARIDIYEKEISKCSGQATRSQPRQRIGGFDIGGFQKPLPPEYRQEFQQYSEVIAGAFQGRPGRFEPVKVTQYVLAVRAQVQAANAAMQSAAGAPATLEGFRAIGQSLSNSSQAFSMLTSAERTQVTQYLQARSTAMAPAIVSAWLAEAAQMPRSLESALATQSRQSSLNGVIDRLDTNERTAAVAECDRLLDLDIQSSTAAATARLAAMPATVEGARALGDWESDFVSHFGRFAFTPSFKTVASQFEKARSRIYVAALPAWQRQVASMRDDSAEIDARRQQLNHLFVVDADRQTPLYAQFSAPVNDKETQMKARQAADEQHRLAEAERVAAAANQPAPAEREAASGTRTGQGRSSAATGTISASHGAGTLTDVSLQTPEGSTGEALKDIYLGEFDKVDMDRTSPSFQAIGSGYIDAYWDKCRDLLPDDRVELTYQRCDSVWVNGYGVETGCANYSTVYTGRYADGHLYRALQSTTLQQVSNGLRSVMDALTNSKDLLSGIMAPAIDSANAKSGGQSIVQQNSCSSNALRRFQDNLERFALGKPGLRLNGTVAMGVAMLPPAPGEVYRDSDYNKLLADMISEQSKTWAINRYVAGSTSGARVISRDSVGRPAEVRGSYSYTGLSNRQSGDVRLSFDEGRPSCLYFDDQPSTCRTPAHALVSAYINGKYRQ